MPIELSYVLGNVLRLLREQAGLTQTELATDAGVDRSYISEIELGKANPTTDILYKLIEHLNTTPGAVITSVDEQLKASSKYSWLDKTKKPE